MTIMKGRGARMLTALGLAAAFVLGTGYMGDAYAWKNGEPPGQTGVKGNNGWGNGGRDGINPGSDNGNQAQSTTKSSDRDR